jgi:hypothetical protein
VFPFWRPAVAHYTPACFPLELFRVFVSSSLPLFVRLSQQPPVLLPDLNLILSGKSFRLASFRPFPTLRLVLCEPKISQKEKGCEPTAHAKTWVISRTDDGFRVYSPADPTKSYIVGGGPDDPTCTCPDFQYREGDPRQRCKHIQAVLEQLGMTPAGDGYEQDERRAIQHENLSEVRARTEGRRCSSNAA